MKKISKYKKYVKELNIIIIALFIFNVITILALIFQSIDYINIKNDNNYKYHNLDSKPIKFFECSNLSLTDTAKCLNEFVIENFKYRITDDNLTLSVVDLVNFGGDCLNWNMQLYGKYMNIYGFKTKSIIIPKNQNESHLATISYDEYSYCWMDLLEVNCFEYAKK